jgi:DNA replication initiation complex subunit (GINS family)
MMDALTFNDLRKIQKEERREEELVELDENFFLKAKEYLNRKEDDGDQRDYTSSKRVFRKIIALREKKIVKNARISLKSNIKASELNLLPREKELFRETKELFEEHRDRIEEINQKSPEEIETEEIDTEEPEPETTENEAPDETEKEEENQEDQGEKEGEDSEDIEDGYQKVKIVNEVPEFMGTDLESYGPFEEGDRPVIPEDNAEILVNRGNAEEA